jgi:hypothetical protein
MRITPLLLALAALPITHAAAQIVVTSGAVAEHQAAPGESWQGTIRLRNPTGQPHEARIYLSDYAFQADGSTTYAAPGTAARSSAAWATVSPSRVTVPAGGEATVAYTVAVPAGRPLAGTFWSMVMVETAPDEPTAALPREGRVRVGVRTAMRYGVQLATTIRGTGAASAAFASPQAQAAAGGHRTLRFDVLNDGDLAYRPHVRLELFDADGAPRGRWEAERGLLYPGTSLRQSFDLGALPAGTYQALVVADAGGESVFGARYRLTL